MTKQSSEGGYCSHRIQHPYLQCQPPNIRQRLDQKGEKAAAICTVDYPVIV